MKVMMKASSILFFFLTMVSCATAPHALPEKYNLDDELEAVDQISISDVSNCENVDDQSIILKADRDNYYLLVLRQPIATKDSHLRIEIESTVSKDKAISTQEIISRSKTSASNGNSAFSTNFTQAPSTIKSIFSGQDRIIVRGTYIVIDKIYRLKGKEQAEEIKKRLRRIRRVGLYI